MFFSLFCFIFLFTNSIFLDTDSTTMHPVMMRETDGHHHHFNHIMMKHKQAAVPMKTGHDAMKWPQHPLTLPYLHLSEQPSKSPTGCNAHENGPTSTNSSSGFSVCRSSCMDWKNNRTGLDRNQLGPIYKQPVFDYITIFAKILAKMA